MAAAQAAGQPERGGACTGGSDGAASDAAYCGHRSSCVSPPRNSTHRGMEGALCAYCVVGAKACSIASAKRRSTSYGAAPRRPAAVRAALLVDVAAAVLLRRVSHCVPVSSVDAAGRFRLGLAAAGIMNPCLGKRRRTRIPTHLGGGGRGGEGRRGGMIADACTIEKKKGSGQSVTSSRRTYIDTMYERRRQVRWLDSRCGLQSRPLSRVTCWRMDKEL